MKLNKASLFAGYTAALWLMSAPMPSMAQNFVGFSGTPQRIESETTKVDFATSGVETWVNIDNYSISVSTDEGGRNVKLDDVVFNKFPGPASTGLFANAVTGTVIKQVVFESHRFSRNGEKLEPYMIVTLSNAVITSIQNSADGNDSAERISVGFQSICVKTISAYDDGRPASEQETCYDKRSGTAY